jgi:CubicO group peptidase (beta-lactamase class C family)
MFEMRETPMPQKLLLVGAFLFGCSGVAFAAPDAPLPFAKPEAVGMSSARLARVGTVIEADIASARIPGAVVAIARHGKLVAFDAYGWRDKAAGLPMTTDTIFNIASMTKPLTAVGALMLYEQGRILMDDPLSKYFPKFAGARVAGRDARGEPTLETVPASRAIIIQDLLRHTSGLIYGNRGGTIIHKMYPAGTGDAPNGPAFMDKLSSLPLLWQPGSTWDYGFGLDITGQIVEKLSGQTLGAYLKANLFTPLAMKDTGFSVPPEKASRYAKPLPADPDSGAPQARSPELTRPLNFDCGGGCAASTAGDYLRFASMLLHQGRAGNTRILGRKTVEFMTSNQLGPEVKNLIANADPTRAEFGFGLGVAVKTSIGNTRMMGSAGSFGWPGASGTDWWVDPKEDLVVVCMLAAPGPARWHYRQVINALVYQSLID